jgi:hypothetical protein
VTTYTPKRLKTHRTRVYDNGWECSCGDWYQAAPNWRLASASAKYHRLHMRRLRSAA